MKSNSRCRSQRSIMLYKVANGEERVVAEDCDDEVAVGCYFLAWLRRQQLYTRCFHPYSRCYYFWPFLLSHILYVYTTWTHVQLGRWWLDARWAFRFLIDDPSGFCCSTCSSFKIVWMISQRVELKNAIFPQKKTVKFYEWILIIFS